MNLLHFKYAVEIAKTHSISKAAENLYMGQPNLSRAVRELEEDLGVAIFKRTSRGISVTPEGEQFLQYARRIIAQVDQVEQIYKGGAAHKQRFSLCAPRASYIAQAFAQFAAGMEQDAPAEFFYKETNSMDAINSVLGEDCNLGIVRYQAAFDKYFKSLFAEKRLSGELVAEFSYVLLVSQNHPLAARGEIALSDLSGYPEICHADAYVPNLPLPDVKKAELLGVTDKHLYVYERASQFTLLEKLPGAYMWVSPVPQELLERYRLVEKHCAQNDKVYKDVLICRKGYSLSALDARFITALTQARRAYLPA
jgi:DNA-binding transcriptional LysR family regulator